MIDYRGYGKSTGNRTEAVLHEDALLAYDYLTKKYSESTIIIYGRSLSPMTIEIKFSSNFLQQIRSDSSDNYSPSNTLIVPRLQFLCIEIARNREGHNDSIRLKFKPQPRTKKC